MKMSKCFDFLAWRANYPEEILNSEANQSEVPGLFPASGSRLVTKARLVCSQVLLHGQAGTLNNEITP